MVVLVVNCYYRLVPGWTLVYVYVSIVKEERERCCVVVK